MKLRKSNFLPVPSAYRAKKEALQNSPIGRIAQQKLHLLVRPSQRNSDNAGAFL
jgi:hypothetical protein